MSATSEPVLDVVPLRSAGIRVLQTLWVGALWTVGYVVAPVLFSQLGSPAAAGALAGAMFTAVSYLSLVCGPLLFLLEFTAGARPRYRNWRLWLLALMLTLIAVGEFGLRPLMEGLPREQFMRMHGYSQMVYLLVSLLGLMLVALPRRDRS